MDAKSPGVRVWSAWPPNRIASLVRRYREMFHPRFAVYLAAIAALVFVAGMAWWAFGPSEAVSYVTVAVTRGTVTRGVTATGSVNPVLTITVGSYVSGVIQEIDCDFNTKVKKGQLCAKIGPRPYQTIVEQDRASVATAKAQLLKDQANLAYTQVDEKRYADLNAQNATSRDSYDIAVNALNQARAQTAVDQATIGQHNAELDAAMLISAMRTSSRPWMGSWFLAMSPSGRRLLRVFRHRHYF